MTRGKEAWELELWARGLRHEWWRVTWRIVGRATRALALRARDSTIGRRLNTGPERLATGGLLGTGDVAGSAGGGARLPL